MAEARDLAELQAELVKIGETMHLDKAEMQTFVKESMDREAKMRQLELKRAEMEKEKDKEREKVALEREKLQAEERSKLEKERLEVEKARLEKERVALELEKEKERLESEERKERAKLESEERIKLAEIKARGAEEDAAEVGARGGNPFGGKGPHIKMPFFREDKDNFDAFLARFESVATTQKWPKD